MPGMDDVSPNTTDDVLHNTTDVSRDTTDTTVDVATAAQRLGISEEAVRARTRRGKLRAEKVGALWRVYLPEGDPAPPDTTSSRDTTQHRDDAQQAVTQHDTTAGDVAQHDGPPITDLAPLVAEIARLSSRNEELAAAAGMWQARAAHLEEQLKQLSATVESATGAGPGETGDEVQSPHDAESVQHSGVWVRLVRWWRG